MSHHFTSRHSESPRLCSVSVQVPGFVVLTYACQAADKPDHSVTRDFMLCKVQLAASLALRKSAKFRLRQAHAGCSWAGNSLQWIMWSAHYGSATRNMCAVQGAAGQVVAGRKRRAQSKVADKTDKEDADQEQASDSAHPGRM